MKSQSIEGVVSEHVEERSYGDEPSISISHSAAAADQGDRAGTSVESEASSDAPEPADVEGAEDRSKKPVKKGNRRSLGWVIACSAILITLIFAYKFVFASKTSAEPSQPASNAQPSGKIRLSPEQTTSIIVETVQKRSIPDEIRSPAKVAFNSNQVSPVLTQFSGRLVALSAEVGQRVTKGEIIGLVETPDIVQPQSDYQQAISNKRTAETSLLNLTRTRERAERLAKVEAIPLRELQQAEVDEKHAREDLERSQQALAAARSRLLALHFKDDEIKGLESGLSVLKREVPLVAPISGTVVERKAGLGQIVQPGGDPLFQIANLSSVWINAEIYEDQIAKLRIGLPATVETAAYPNDHFAARVDQIGNVVDPDKRTVAVRCVLSNSSGKFKPGMFVNVSLGGVSSREVITVPSTAVITEGEKSIVYIEVSPGVYEKRDIVLGGDNDGTVVVKSGLSNGERVVVKGGLLIAAEGDNA